MKSYDDEVSYADVAQALRAELSAGRIRVGYSFKQERSGDRYWGFTQSGQIFLRSFDYQFGLDATLLHEYFHLTHVESPLWPESEDAIQIIQSDWDYWWQWKAAHPDAQMKDNSQLAPLVDPANGAYRMEYFYLRSKLGRGPYDR